MTFSDFIKNVQKHNKQCTQPQEYQSDILKQLDVSEFRIVAHLKGCSITGANKGMLLRRKGETS
ncbi:hypothetical protein [Lentilitoribacter sp. EG35]|uniref:hypothetical protein n=1 Tax=Lentilitoribacter sp. EG35 TaxID=3234192 RepID=UPI0034602DD3